MAKPKLYQDIDTINSHLGTHDVQLADIVQQKAENESATLGANLVDGIGWTSTGWTGSFATGFIHTAGNTNQLIKTMTSTGTKKYQIEFDVSSPLSQEELTISLGNSASYDLYNAGYTHVKAGVTSVSDGNLVFTPTSSFNKTITNITVVEITDTADTTWAVKDSTNVNVLEYRGTKASLNNLFLGVNSGMYNTGGKENIAIGGNTLQKNTTGFWNAAIGANALSSNVGGSRNNAIGYFALGNNISGLRNIAIGSYALSLNTSGNQNIGIGADSLINNTTGNSNIGIGAAALGVNTSGFGNVAIGDGTLTANTTYSENVAIGYAALGSSASYSNTAVGYSALKGLTTGGSNTGIGNRAGRKVTTGVNNTFIGNLAGDNASQKVDASNCIVIGNNAYTTASNTCQIGDTALTNVGSHGDFEAQDIGDGFICKSPNGTRYRMTVNDAGTVIATAI